MREDPGGPSGTGSLAVFQVVTEDQGVRGSESLRDGQGPEWQLAAGFVWLFLAWTHCSESQVRLRWNYFLKLKGFLELTTCVQLDIHYFSKYLPTCVPLPCWALVPSHTDVPVYQVHVSAC